MLYKIITTTSLFLSFVVCLLAQPGPRPVFSRITRNEGLASNTVFQTVRDKKGFLWIATQNGLQRYDGNRFVTFRHVPGDSVSILQNSIAHLFIDSKERLWVMFDRQAGIFHTASFRFTPVSIGTPVGMIRKMMEDDKGRILLFADNKLFVYDETQHSFQQNYPLPALPAGYTLNDLAIDPVSHQYWFTGKQGSVLYDPPGKQFYTKEQNSIQATALQQLGPVTHARFPFIAKDGTWWMVSWIPFSASAPVLYSYDKKNNRLQKYEQIRPFKAESYHEIWGIFQQSDGTIWIYGMGLLAYYHSQENRFIHIDSNPFQQNGIKYDYVSNLYEDREKNIWVSTNEGLYRFNTDAQVFRNISNRRFKDTAIAPNVVSVILHTQHNGIWVSTWGAGVFSYDDQFRPVPNPITAADPLNKSLHAGYMIQRRNGEVWIGTQIGQLKIYEPTSGNTYSVTPPLLKDQTITALLEDHAGNIWIGSTSGILVKCKDGNWKDTAAAYTSILPEGGDILKLYEDRNRHLWICTATNGLYETDSGDGHVIRQFDGNSDNKKGLLTNGATDIVQYNDSLFLIASEGICILNNRTGTFRYLLPGVDLPAEHITNLIIDKKNRLWVACDGGLYRLNIDNGLYVTYDAPDGIINDVFQVASASLLKDGRIAIGGLHDFLIFDPETAIDRNEVPPVHATGFVRGTSRLSMDSLQHLKEITLSYNNTFVRIELSTLGFRDRYYMYYMLEGLDKEWKPVHNNEIIYQYLPSGHYTLKLKSQNGDGVETKTITSLRIVVTTPFWKTWWFYSLLSLLLAGLFFWLDHQRIKRKTAILSMRSHIADDLHQDINAALGNITILSEMAKMKADREPQKSKEFIEQIHTKSQDMTVAMEDILWSIDPGNDSMENFVLRLREHIEALKSQYNVKIALQVDKKALDVQLRMKSRHNVFWLFRNGITNVVKTGAADCSIHITYDKPYLVYRLQFDTSAMDMEKLHNLRQRSELMDKLEELAATLDFSSHDNKAGFVLSIPVRKNGI